MRLKGEVLSLCKLKRAVKNRYKALTRASLAAFQAEKVDCTAIFRIVYTHLAVHSIATVWYSLLGVFALYAVFILLVAVDIAARIRDFNLRFRSMASTALHDWIFLMAYFLPAANLLVIQLRVPVVTVAAVLALWMSGAAYLAWTWAPSLDPPAISRGTLLARSKELARKSGVELNRLYIVVADPWIPWFSSSPSKTDLVMTWAFLDRLNRSEVDALLARQIGYGSQAPMVFACIACEFINLAFVQFVPSVQGLVWLILMPVEIVGLLSLIWYRDVKADREAIRITGRPDALIMAIVKVDRMSSRRPLPLRVLTPLEWRIKEIARAANISDERLTELLRKVSLPSEELYVVDEAAVMAVR